MLAVNSMGSGQAWLALVLPSVGWLLPMGALSVMTAQQPDKVFALGMCNVGGFCQYRGYWQLATAGPAKSFLLHTAHHQAYFL